MSSAAGAVDGTLASRTSRPILILSASSGEGHVRAGQALEKAFALCEGCAAKHLDALEYTTKGFRKIYNDAFVTLVRRAPAMMGLLYSRFDKPWRKRRLLALDRWNTRPMVRLLERAQPDLCVATHFLPAEIISWLVERKKLRTKLAVVITDFDAHAMWLCRSVDRYYVAIEETAEYLARLGVPRHSLRVTGIPIDPAFCEPKDRRAIRMRLGLDPSRTTVLVAAGGHSVGPVERLVSDLLGFGRPWQIVVITGHAGELRQRLERVGSASRSASSNASRLRVVGYTQEMDQWMAAADLLAGKAGALTVSEALASGLPLVMVGSLAGPQEERNADQLLEQGAGIRCHNLPTAAWKIARLLDDPAQVARMRAAACAMARPRAALEIAADCRRLLEDPAMGDEAVF